MRNETWRSDAESLFVRMCGCLQAAHQRRSNNRAKMARVMQRDAT
jgi:hypothetical protein